MKNRKLKYFGFSLILCLLSMCVMSGTLAKYTETVYGKGAAAVANFSFEFKAGDTVINSTSAKQATTVNLFNTVSDTGVADDPNYLIAPGTSGKLPLSFKNYSDVTVKVIYGITLDENGRTVPLVFHWGNSYYSDYFAAHTKVNSRAAGASADGAQITIDGSLAQLKTDMDVSNAFIYAPHNTTADDLISGHSCIEWFWAFEGGDGSTQTDAFDTILGRLSALSNRVTAYVTITAVITQLDS